jgi:hypothetical protein
MFMAFHFTAGGKPLLIAVALGLLGLGIGVGVAMG